MTYPLPMTYPLVLICPQSQDSQGSRPEQLNHNNNHHDNNDDDEDEDKAVAGGGGGGGGNGGGGRGGGKGGANGRGGGGGNDINNANIVSEERDIDGRMLLHTIDSTKKTKSNRGLLTATPSSSVLREATAVKAAQSNSPVKSRAHQSNPNPTVDLARVRDVISKTKGYKVGGSPCCRS